MDWNAGGSFACSKSYTDAPNPILNLSNLGTIGLPLGTRDAESIKSVAHQMPFAVEEHASGGTSGQGIWEMGASAVSWQHDTTLLCH